LSTAALTLGFVGVVYWLVPHFGFPINLIGIILAAIAILLKKPDKNLAQAGLIMCVIGLALSIVSFIVFSKPIPMP
jgi:hypothetical protein